MKLFKNIAYAFCGVFGLYLIFYEELLIEKVVGISLFAAIFFNILSNVSHDKETSDDVFTEKELIKRVKNKNNEEILVYKVVKSKNK